MTQLLEKAIEKLSKLPNEEQDSFASLLLEELADDTRWNDSFRKSEDQLAKLAKEALEEYHAGKTKEEDPSNCS